MLRALFFDAAGTLLHLTRSVGENYAEIARRFGANLDARDLDRAFHETWKKMPLRPPIDGPRPDDDKPWWRDLVDDVLARVPNVPANFDRAQFFDAAYAHFAEPGVWLLFPDVRDTLTELQPRYRLFVVSNFDHRLRAILADLGIADFFEQIFLSSELGADKPHPEIYQRALRQSGLSVNEVCHIGDDPERDCRAAAGVGLHVFQLDRPRISLRDLPAALRRLASSREVG
ncbi:MAG: HAD family hydrolase [Verrucomicrobiota bacterium]|nr:HAD family hydrolase [Verrucomicrobiota bacterium]